MPARLNVIMTESLPATSSGKRLAESAVGELIGQPGIDLTLIGNLSEIEDDSTIRVTLDGISGDVAVLDWQANDVVLDSLRTAGLEGRRTPHEHDREAPPSDPADRSGGQSSRRIYLFDLRKFSAAADLCRALSDLRAKQEIRTYSLIPASDSETPPSKPPVSGPVSGPLSRSADPAETPQQSPPPKFGRQPTESGHSNASSGRTTSQRPGLDLDDLVERLDEFDQD